MKAFFQWISSIRTVAFQTGWCSSYAIAHHAYWTFLIVLVVGAVIEGILNATEKESQ